MVDLNISTIYVITVLSLSIFIYLYKNRIKVPDGEIHFLLNGEKKITVAREGEIYQFWPIVGLFIMNLPAKRFVFPDGEFSLEIPRMEVFDINHNPVHIDIKCLVEIKNHEKLKEFYIPGNKRKLRSIVVKMIYRILYEKSKIYQSTQLTDNKSELETGLIRTLTESLGVYGIKPVDIKLDSIIY